MEISDVQRQTWHNKLAKGFNRTDVAPEFGLLTAEGVLHRVADPAAPPA